MFLKQIKTAIDNKELSIAVPGRREDMIAFTSDQTPKINDAVDFVHVSLRRDDGELRTTDKLCQGNDLRSDESTNELNAPSLSNCRFDSCN